MTSGHLWRPHREQADCVQAIDLGLDGQVAIVTGAGSRGSGVGNGRAAAILLARAGCRVVLVDHVEDWARETERMISAEGGHSIVLEGDVSRDAECARIVDGAIARFGDVSVLVNNVGVAGPAGTAVEVDPDEWDTAMQVNVKSMMLMSRHAIPSLRRTGGGSIVNMSSAAGLVGGHPALMYATSKGAITNMTRSMAVHHGPDGIRVNCVAPGMVYTPMVTSRGMCPSFGRPAASGRCCRPKARRGTNTTPESRGPDGARSALNSTGSHLYSGLPKRLPKLA